MTTRELSRKIVEELVRFESPGPCLSIYLPTHRFGRETAVDAQRLGKLMPQARQALADETVDAMTIEGLLAPLQALVDDPEFWQHQRHGLALFATPEGSLAVSLDVPVRERVEAGTRFLIAPLVAALPAWEHFFVLALSLEQVRVLEATPGSVRRLEPEGLPASIDQALGYDQFDVGSQRHSASGQGHGHRPAIVHGQSYGDKNRRDSDVLQFFRQVVLALGNLPETTAPWVLAADHQHFPLLNKINGNLPFLSEGLPGNPEPLSDAELAERARWVVESWATRQIDEARHRFLEHADRSRVVSAPTEVVAAADEGRIDTLLFAADGELWGRWQPELRRVEIHEERATDDLDLLDLTVSRTLAQGGHVFTGTLPPGTEHTPFAAILRY